MVTPRTSVRTRAVAVVAAVVALLVVFDTRLAHACSPGEEAVFGEVVARGADVDRTPVHLGVIEQRVVAHAAPVPLLTSRRSVWVVSRTWGDVDGSVPGPQRHSGHLATLFRFISNCPARPAPRTGDVMMTAVVESSSGAARQQHWMAEEPYSFDPTFEGGLTTVQEEALTARFGSPEHLSKPSPGRLVAWWL